MPVDEEQPLPVSAVGADVGLFMGEALRLARAAATEGEVPVGAVVVVEGEIAGRGWNRPIGANDPTAHAEIVALREAAASVGNYRLPGALLVVTLEPCLMCLGAMLQARVGQILYGAPDARLGATRLLAEAQSVPGGLNHRIQVSGGVREEECAAVLRTFFAERRAPGRTMERQPSFSFQREHGRLITRAEQLDRGEVPKWS